MKKLLLSIKPKYVKAIISGNKTIEYRRRVPRESNVSKVLIYRSNDLKQIIGEFSIDQIYEDTPRGLWQLTHTKGCISEDAYYSYFKDSTKAYGILIKDLVIFSTPRDITFYGLKRPPMSFCYIEDDLSTDLMLN